MPQPARTIAELLRQDLRYKFDAYAFVFDALRYGHEVLGLGTVQPGAGSGSEGLEPDETTTETADERHLTGQELCEAIRQYALREYGYMAKCVLENWGVRTTGDFGEIVFNLIRIGEFRKTEQDRREDFDNVFDFETGLNSSFRISPPDEKDQAG